MSSLVDTSVLVDVLRRRSEALAALEAAREKAPVHASEITRAEVHAGMRNAEASITEVLLDSFIWHAVDRQVAQRAGELARRWRPSHGGIDMADFVIAATAELLGATLLTRNVRHFPMFSGLAAPY